MARYINPPLNLLALYNIITSDCIYTWPVRKM